MPAETLSLIIVGAGLILMVIARLLIGRTETITRRAYSRRYSDAPGALTDR
jgi:hypothetical protein